MTELGEYSDLTDEAIVPLVFERAHHFGMLMERYEARLLRYIMRLSSVQTEEAEDILQEVFLKAYRHLHDFDTGLRFSTWIYRICHNQVISHYRRSKARPVTLSLAVEPALADTLASEVDLTAEIDRLFLRQHLSAVLQQLDVKHRDVLVLRYLEEKEYQEISDILQKPIGTISALLHRAKKQCAAIMRDKQQSV